MFIDGVRYSETFGDPSHQYIPHMWNHLRPIGTINTTFYNNGQTVTAPGHTSALTGIWQQIRNDGLERPHNKPTIFELYRKQKGVEDIKTWVVVYFPHLLASNYSDVEGYGRDYGAKLDSPMLHTKDTPHENANLDPLATSGDGSVWAILRAVMDQDKPSLVMVNFGQTDSSGHSGSWSAYTNAIRDADMLIYYLWLKIQSMPYYKDKTTLIVTSDHGRYLDGIGTGFVGHGGGDEGNRHIMFLAVGPNIRAGAEDNTRRQLIDIGPTIASMLGIEMPGVQGQVMTELLRQ